MFLVLNHQELDIHRYSRQFVTACYSLAKKLPPEEKFILSSQIRRAALSVHLNIAESASRKSSAERKRFYEVARGSLIEVDAALDIAKDLNLINDPDLESIGTLIVKCFSMLSKLIKSQENNH
ncbi:four helix bundle protein [Terrimonas ferruginea]|uniref:four helix bundle protein n=1 Tax=Terrimonas ferruginea TaxID=249 RepID=UPI0004911A75|nr:four helix bundle protein [Terrimonas ferruginea]